jgi:acid phosphatase
MWLPKASSGYWLCDSDDTSPAPRIHLGNISGQTRRYATVLDPSLIEFPPNCRADDITLQGMQEIRALGAFYRGYLIDNLHFLPRDLDSSLLNLRATYVDRTFRAAESFLGTFYPPARPGELMTITTGSDYLDYLSVDYALCRDLSNAWAQFQNSSVYRRRADAAQRLYAALFAELNVTMDGTNWMYLGDWLASAYCGGQKIPSNVTDAIFDQALKDAAFYTWGPMNEARGVAGSAIFRELFRVVDAGFAGHTKEKFFLFSASDAAIVALISTLGVYKEQRPRYRSHLGVEFWKSANAEVSVRFVWDGVAQPVNGQEIIKYTDLKTFLQPYLNYCKEYE